MPPRNWSEQEVEAAVEDYFDMLRAELNGQDYNKTAHRRVLIEKLEERSHGSVELKHQNISAVLIEMGAPYIEGYKPRGNYQRSILPRAVSGYLDQHPDFLNLFHADAATTPEVPKVSDFLSVMETPPKTENSNPTGVHEPSNTYTPFPINYLEQEARNQALGDAGEEFVLNYERARLIHAGKESLADKIEHVASTIGPSAGFDIRSFEVDGTDRFIEAKTTKHGKSTPFFVTPNELRFSSENQDRYFLYRIFRFRKDPRLFALQGQLHGNCTLEPSEFKATPA